jgi:hypothetical protein
MALLLSLSSVFLFGTPVHWLPRPYLTRLRRNQTVRHPHPLCQTGSP